LHITLVIFKLRHICVFSIKKVMNSGKNLVFLGMMGSGKSSIGLMISKKLNLEFFDTDQCIETEVGMKISKIFEKRGEIFFREYEKKLTLNLLKKKNSIIALGGGGFLNKEIQKAVLSNNLSFWLNWEIKILIKRIIGSPKRPVAYNSTKSELIEMINLRNKQYSKAMFKVDCSDLTKNEVVNKIIDIYESKKTEN